MRLKHIFALVELMDLGREENTFLHILTGSFYQPTYAIFKFSFDSSSCRALMSATVK